MTNITLTIDEDLLRRARIRAIEQNTSVNALVREFLESYVGADDREEARREILKLARQPRRSRDGLDRAWSREELYEERLARYEPR